MSDSNGFCQSKFGLVNAHFFLVVVLMLMLCSCGGNSDPYDNDIYNKTGYVPTRYTPYRQPAYSPTYPVYRNPYSRTYQNPYEFQHQNPYYPSYYDQDQYYVPPSNYRNIEPEYDFGADQKS